MEAREFVEYGLVLLAQSRSEEEYTGRRRELMASASQQFDSGIVREVQDALPDTLEDLKNLVPA